MSSNDPGHVGKMKVHFTLISNKFKSEQDFWTKAKYALWHEDYRRLEQALLERGYIVMDSRTAADSLFLGIYKEFCLRFKHPIIVVAPVTGAGSVGMEFRYDGASRPTSGQAHKLRSMGWTIHTLPVGFSMGKIVPRSTCNPEPMGALIQEVLGILKPQPTDRDRGPICLPEKAASLLN